MVIYPNALVCGGVLGNWVSLGSGYICQAHGRCLEAPRRDNACARHIGAWAGILSDARPINPGQELHHVQYTTEAPFSAFRSDLFMAFARFPRIPESVSPLDQYFKQPVDLS
jgi:hypothetical protein